MRNNQRTSKLWQWLALASMVVVPATSSADEHEANTTWDGLVAVADSRFAVAYVNPEADFSGFKRIAILDPYVAFRANWKRDQNRSRSHNVRASDVERIKGDVGELFLSVFTEQLEAAGYEVVNYADEDVLILRPAIADLDISAPDVRSAGRSRTYTSSAGAATVFLELFDSLSGDLLGRAVDRRGSDRAFGFTMQSNRVSNRAAARREFRAWADRLIEFLDQHYVKAGAAE